MKAKPSETRQAPPAPLGPLGLALAADAAYGAELRRLFGARAGDLRYARAGAGLPGSALRRLSDAKLVADAELARVFSALRGE
jgi:hypothetical protein